MGDEDLKTLLVAQVITLAATLETLNRVKGKGMGPNYEREAARLINRRAAAVLQLLTETR